VTNGATITTNIKASYEWRISNAPPPYYVRLQVTPISTNALVAATALNRPGVRFPLPMNCRASW